MIVASPKHVALHKDLQDLLMTSYNFSFPAPNQGDTSWERAAYSSRKTSTKKYICSPSLFFRAEYSFISD